MHRAAGGHPITIAPAEGRRAPPLLFGLVFRRNGEAVVCRIAEGTNAAARDPCFYPE